jgi:hypothetical protein
MTSQCVCVRRLDAAAQSQGRLALDHAPSDVVGWWLR